MKKKIILDYMMASTIFVVAVIELISWFLSNIPVKDYLVFWFPLLSTIEIWFFSLFFFLRILRYESCIYTQLACIFFFAIQCFNVTAYFAQFGLKFYNKIAFPAFCGFIILITITKIIRCSLNQSKRSL